MMGSVPFCEGPHRAPSPLLPHEDLVRACCEPGSECPPPADAQHPTLAFGLQTWERRTPAAGAAAAVPRFSRLSRLSFFSCKVITVLAQ